LGFEWVRAPFGTLWARWLLGREWYLWFVNFYGIVVTNWRVWRAARTFRATHLYATSVTHYSYAMLAFAWLRLPVVYRAGDEFPQHNFIYRWFARRLVRRVDSMVCISQHIFKSCAAAGMQPELMRVIYNSPPQRRAAAKPELPPVPPGAVVIVFVGQVTEQKGIFVLLDAVEQMIRAGANVVLWVVGSTGWDETGFFDGLKMRVAKMGMAERICFLGYVTNVQAVLERADVHVCPSIYEEPLSNVVGEAKLAGKPSVVFPSGGLPELIEQGVDGLVCRERSVGALVEGLEFFTKDAARRVAAGAAARRSLDEKFGRENFVGAWTEVFLATRC
jgi:glycosyltransferase involved in cell wall biosynthesis